LKNKKESLVSNSESNKAETGKIVHSKTDQFPIAGIGASAGGFEAMEQFFGHMPANSGMAFFGHSASRHQSQRNNA
jgi:two-component system CheB/CheR fusion protein